MAHWCFFCNEALRCNSRHSLKHGRPSTCGDSGIPTTEATYCPIQSSCLIFLIYKQALDSQPLIKTQFAFPEQCVLIDTIWARVGALQKLQLQLQNHAPCSWLTMKAFGKGIVSMCLGDQGMPSFKAKPECQATGFCLLV